MRLTLSSVLLILIVYFIRSQSLTVSPYSYFGIGERKFDTDVVLRSMAGGLSSTYISDLGNEVNYSNPAANMNLFYTSFNVSMDLEYDQFKTSTEKSTYRNGNISNISLAFPLGKKTKIGIGFQPFSALGFDVSIRDNTNDPAVSLKYKGRGGLNSLHNFISYNLSKEVALGLRTNLLFGSFEKEAEALVDGASLITGLKTRSSMNTLMFTPGFVWSKPLKNSKKFVIGGTYSFSNNLNTDTEILHRTYFYTQAGSQFGIDTIQYIRTGEKSRFAQEASFGISLGKELKWQIGADVRWRGLSDMQMVGNNYNFNDSFRYSLGGFWIPDINSYRNYVSKIWYRAGVYYETTGLTLNNTEINQLGVNFGLGLPIGKKSRQDPSMFNLGFEYGIRGTTDNSLIQENFFLIKVGLVLDDRWFRKSVFD